MKFSKVLWVCSSSFIALHAWSADLSVNLGSKTSIPQELNTATASPSIQWSIDPEEIAEEIKSGDISIEANRDRIEIQVQTSSPSFTHKKFAVIAKDNQGNVVSNSENYLSVNPVFLVIVSDSGNDKAPFHFDSDSATAYFRPHPEGLQLIFKNNASQAFIIHGSGAIQHAMNSTAPGESYTPAPILPSLGVDVPGYYTFHGIYTPDRNAIFNASQIPASKK